MSYQTTILADSPAAYWRLGEASGLVASDLSGNARHGAIAGTGVTYGVAGAVDDANTALLLDGSTGRISIPQASMPAFGTGPFSVELWLKTTTANGGYLIDNKMGSAGIAGFSLQISTGPSSITGYVGIDGAGAYAQGMSPVGSFHDDAWHQVVMTLTRGGSDTLRLYADGLIRSTGTVSTAGWNITSPQQCHIGSRLFDANWYPGSVDEVSLYTTALSDGQVAAHYAARSAAGGPTFPGLFLGI